MTTAAQPDPSRIWFAHVLRGPACVLVMLDHLYFGFAVYPTEVSRTGHFTAEHNSFTPPLAAIFDFENGPRLSIGMVALIQLFLISGFVIPYSLARNPVRSFTVRRLFRLYPTLWVGVMVTLAVVAVQAHVLGTPFPHTVREVSMNATVFAPYFGVAWIDPSYWTLAAEEIFYFVAALMAWRGVLGNAKWIVTASVACAAVAVIPVSGHNPLRFWFEYHMTLLPFVFIGVSMHEVFTKRWPVRKGLVVGLVLFGLWCFAVTTGPWSDGIAAAWITASAVGVPLFVAIAAAGSRLPYSRIMDKLASISYPVYLLHQIIGYVLVHALTQSGVNFYLAILIVVTIIISSAVVLHHLVEMPSVRLGRRLGKQLADRRLRADVAVEG